MSNSGASAGIDEPVVLDHIGQYLGPSVIAVCIQGLESGLLINQMTHFWLHVWDKQTWMIRILVVIVSVVSMGQTALSFWQTWMIYVINFGNLAFALAPSTVDNISGFVTTAMAVPCQVFLIWRCWELTGKRRYILWPLVGGLIASAVMSIYISLVVAGWTTSPKAVVANTGKPVPQFWHAYLGFCAIEVVMNTAVSAILLVHLGRKQRSLICRGRMGFDGLVLVTWKSSLPATALSWSILILLFVSSYPTTWSALLEWTVGKLFVITVFVTLNSSVNTPLPPTNGTRASQVRFRSIIPISLAFPEQMRRAQLDGLDFPTMSRNVPITLSQVPSLSIPPTPIASFAARSGENEKDEDTPRQLPVARARSLDIRQTIPSADGQVQCTRRLSAPPHTLDLQPPVHEHRSV